MTQRSINPIVRKITRQAVRNNGVKLWKKESENLLNVFQKITGKKTLTLDLWAFRQEPVTFQYVIAHYFDAKLSCRKTSSLRIIILSSF